MMSNFVKYFIWTWAIVQFVNADRLATVAAPNQQSLANLIFTSSLTSKDPQAAFGCFVSYTGKINRGSEDYKENYTNCLLEANEFRRRVEHDMSAQRATILNTTRELCQRWEGCNGHNVTLDVFVCHSKEAVTQARDVYNISDNADEYANVLLGRYRDVESNYEHCCKSAERRYAEISAEVYNTLKECLKGQKETVVESSTGTESTTNYTLMPTPTSLW